MIGQQIGLPYLVPITLQRLRANALAEGAFYPGDLLANVLRVDAEFCIRQPQLARSLQAIVKDLQGHQPADIEPALVALVAQFNGDHPNS